MKESPNLPVTITVEHAREQAKVVLRGGILGAANKLVSRIASKLCIKLPELSMSFEPFFIQKDSTRSNRSSRQSNGSLLAFPFLDGLL